MEVYNLFSEGVLVTANTVLSQQENPLDLKHRHTLFTSKMQPASCFNMPGKIAVDFRLLSTFGWATVFSRPWNCCKAKRILGGICWLVSREPRVQRKPWERRSIDP